LRQPGRFTLTSLECPGCRNVIAVLRGADRCLYRPGRGGGLGAPLSTDPRADVAVYCGHCGKTAARSCGRAVYYRLRSGQPPFG
jgi:hypothetical protein